jgi:hypothetical protein
MASIKSIPLDRNDSDEFLNLNSRSDIRGFVDSCINLLKVESVPEQLCTGLERSLYNCVHSFTKTYSLIRSDASREEFRAASKRHQRTLNSILTFIIQSFRTDGYSTNITLDRFTIKIKIGSITVLTEDIKPRSFLPWYKALNVFTNVEGLTVHQLTVIARILTSVYNIVNEPRLRPSEKDRMTLDLVTLLSAEPKYTTIQNFINPELMDESSIYNQGVKDLIETVMLIKHYSLTYSMTPPKWAHDIVMSLRRLYRQDRSFLYDNIHPMLSVSSTCSSMLHKGKRRTIPGLFASCIEPDYFKANYPNSNFDQIVGFKNTYDIDLHDLKKKRSFKSKRRFSVSIDQKKPKPRIIHPLNNSEQDRLIYYHRLLESVLSNIPSDCTFDQSKGSEHIKYVMNSKEDWGIYSLDLTSATDTFNIGLQYLIIKELIFNNKEYADELSSVWLDIMTSETVIHIKNEDHYFRFSNGQPQGFLSSFPAFSLEHHIVMLTVLRKFLPETRGEDFYRVLGDDSLITSSDDNFEIPKLYQYYINSANVECNITKGYLYNLHEPNHKVKIAEFAKQLIVDGIEVTPIPTKLLTQNETISDVIARLGWYSQHSNTKLSISNLKYYIELWNKWDLKHYSLIIDTLVGLMLPGVFRQCFKKNFLKVTTGFNQIDITLIQFLLTSTILYSVMDKIIGDKPINNDLKGFLHVSHEIKPFITALSDPEKVSVNNKVWILKESISSVYYTMVELCRNYTVFHELDEDTLMLACMLLQVNNSDTGSEKIRNVFKALDLLTIDANSIVSQSEIDRLGNEMLDLYKDFNITIERSWSSFSRHIPIDFLQKAITGINDLLKKRSYTLEEYIQVNGLSISPDAVHVEGSDILSGDTFSIFDNSDDYYDEI